MNKYESVIITKPEITLPEIIKVTNMVEGLVNVIRSDEIGIKKLAYEVKGNKEGYFIIFYLEENLEKISELEKYYRNEDLILKYITVRNDD